MPRYPGVPLLALTATATQRVQRDVVLQLAMAHAVCFRSSFNRANLRPVPPSQLSFYINMPFGVLLA